MNNRHNWNPPHTQQYPQPQQPQHIHVNYQQPQRKKINHVLHFVLTILTGGAWGLVWLILAISNK